MAKALTIFTCAVIVLLFQAAAAQTLNWKGREWKITSGGMAGVARGNPANIRVDENGFLHLGIVKRGGTWSASELFTIGNLGFGTYQWVVEGDVYAMDKSTVLGLFTYGPSHHIGVDAENEIDIEFSQWNRTCNGCNADFTVYPSTGNRKPNGVSAWEDNFHVVGGNLTTARMERTAGRITFTIMKGVQPIGKTEDVLKTEVYSSNTTNIPQELSPVGINLWCFKEAPAADQSVIIRDFQFVAQ